MIFNDEMIFIHIGKTGGMSCSKYLLRNLKPPVYNCHRGALDEMKNLPKTDGIVPVPEIDINRHSTLTEALDFIRKFKGKTIDDFSKIVAVIRHPYTLEYSFYKHLRKPRVVERRKAKNADLLSLAEGDFKNFVEKAPYHRRGYSQDSFFKVANEVPDNVELVRFERLSIDFPAAVAPFLKKGSESQLPHHNRTEYQSDISQVLTEDVKTLLYQKHKFMFDSGLYSTF